MTTGFETYTADFTSKINMARRSDGRWFTRIQTKDARYGYRWTAWRETVADSDNEFMLRPVTWRLPK